MLIEWLLFLASTVRSLETRGCVTTQSILWHYIQPITSSIDIDSIAFKCSSEKKPIDRKVLFNRSCPPLDHQNFINIFRLISFCSPQFNLFYWVVKKNHRIFIWPEAYFYNLICHRTHNDWSLQLGSQDSKLCLINSWIYVEPERFIYAHILHVKWNARRWDYMSPITNCNIVFIIAFN